MNEGSRIRVPTREVRTEGVYLWHALPFAEVLTELDTNEDGLKSAEAARRLALNGPNQLPAPPRTHPVLRFLAQFNSVLIYFLLAAAAAAGFLGHAIDAAVIVAVVLVNAAVGFVQEGKAEKALYAIRDMIAPHATVLREGKRHSIDAREIVTGDIVVVEAGDKTPADLRLTRARNLLADEALLTGESLPAGKAEKAVAVEAFLGDRFSMLYSGTLIATGQATGIAVATGADTEIGRISTLIGQVQTQTTPLLRQIDHFGKLITWFAIGMAALIFAFAILVRDYAWPEALMVVVALAVGVVPEGLPAIISITLAIGVQRMARRNAVVRRLPAVETLGATSVICSDKTGTLTKNEMTARRIVTAEKEYLVEGAGYVPVGTIDGLAGDAAPGLDSVRADLVRAALLCNDAQLVESEGRWSVHGDPMEGALVTLAMKSGLHPESERSAWARLDEIPFDAQHRFMATLNRAPGGDIWVFVKGAPERVLDMCKSQAARGSAETVAAYWQMRIAAAGGSGERMLGFAAIKAGAGMERLSFRDVESGLAFLGIVGFIDPPREEAIAAITSSVDGGETISHAEIPDEDAARLCPNYAKVQEVGLRAGEKADALGLPKGPGRGQWIHTEAEREMKTARIEALLRAGGMQELRVEEIFPDTGKPRYLKSGSSKIDVVEKIGDDAVCVYDFKTGSATFPNHVRERYLREVAKHFGVRTVYVLPVYVP